MYIRRINIVLIIVTVVLGYGIFAIKNSTKNLQDQLNLAQKKLDVEQDKIMVLHAEITYLLAPSNIRSAMARKTYRCVSKASRHYVSNNNIDKDIQWRYKANGLRLISHH